MFKKFINHKNLDNKEPQKIETKSSSEPSPNLVLMYSYFRAIIDIIHTTLPDQQKITAINKLLKVLTLKIQNYITEQVIINHDNSYRFRADFPKQDEVHSCPTCRSSYILYSAPIRLADPITLPLVTTSIISLTWSYDRLIKNFSNIGVAINNPYFYDEINHFDTRIYLPTGICVCHNGIHSTTTAIYDDNGSIVANQYINTEKWYSEIYFDGTAFICKKCNNIITTPPCPEVGILFEIGRILIQNNFPMVTIDIPTT